MRAMRGNTQPVQQVRVAWWNARHWDGGGAKWEWLEERLRERPVDVLMLLEVELDLHKRKVMVRRARAAGYKLRWSGGKFGGTDAGVGGIVCMMRSATTRWCGGAVRLAPRVYAICVRHVSCAEPLHVAAIHGLQGDEEGTFKGQMQAVRTWVREHGDTLLVGDWNRVLCSTWRAAGGELTSDDRMVRQLAEWECSCCDREGEEDGELFQGHVLGGCGGQGGCIGWTRYDTHGGLGLANSST
jgi:endonuclease/exonuclease/phosphatase family metal-dependent hydrolase